MAFPLKAVEYSVYPGTPSQKSTVEHLNPLNPPLLSLVSIRQKAIATAKHDMIQRASVKRSCGSYGMKTKEVADVGHKSQIALPKDRKIM